MPQSKTWRTFQSHIFAVHFAFFWDASMRSQRARSAGPTTQRSDNVQNGWKGKGKKHRFVGTPSKLIHSMNARIVAALAIQLP
jgi:hypothetical protein